MNSKEQSIRREAYFEKIVRELFRKFTGTILSSDEYTREECVQIIEHYAHALGNWRVLSNALCDGYSVVCSSDRKVVITLHDTIRMDELYVDRWSKVISSCPRLSWYRDLLRLLLLLGGSEGMDDRWCKLCLALLEGYTAEYDSEGRVHISLHGNFLSVRTFQFDNAAELSSMPDISTAFNPDADDIRKMILDIKEKNFAAEEDRLIQEAIMRCGIDGPFIEVPRHLHIHY